MYFRRRVLTFQKKIVKLAFLLQDIFLREEQVKIKTYGNIFRLNSECCRKENMLNGNLLGSFVAFRIFDMKNYFNNSHT